MNLGCATQGRSLLNRGVPVGYAVVGGAGASIGSRWKNDEAAECALCEICIRGVNTGAGRECHFAKDRTATDAVKIHADERKRLGEPVGGHQHLGVALGWGE